MGSASWSRRWGRPPVGLVVASAIGALVLAGCGGSTETGGQRTGAAAPTPDNTDGGYAATGFTKDPCSLLSQGEVASALGGSVTATPSTSLSGLKGCGWTKPGNSTGVADLQLHYNSAPLSRAFKVGLERNLLAPGERRVDVGNGAVLKSGRGDIYVLVGDSEFEVNGPVSKPLPDNVVTSLAKLAASRLP